MKWFQLALGAFFAIASVASANGKYYEVTYAPSKKEGELKLGVTYTVWIPESDKPLRGVIVHQHGCGTGACKGGATAAYDLHWQALAAKWNCALLGPSYHQDDKDNCRWWCDPRNGSDVTFRKALTELGEKAKRPELDRVPWCLWGHSGGGFWASIMQAMHPGRIVAIWYRSGTAFGTWGKADDVPDVKVPDAAYGIPIVLNPGLKEKDDKRFGGLWKNSEAMMLAYREKGAPVTFAADPKTSHECGDSRYLAIPFFDACLALRLPEIGAKEQQLKPVDAKKGYAATMHGKEFTKLDEYKGEAKEMSWLPNETVANAWKTYVTTGTADDKTPPAAPTKVVVAKSETGRTLTWDAQADFESGLKQFIVLRDGKEIGTLPEKPIGRFGRALFQTMSYHDTPEKPLPEMKFLDKTAKADGQYEYRVIAVNSQGLKSEPSAPGMYKAK